MVGTDFGLKYWNCYGVVKMNKKESKRERKGRRGFLRFCCWLTRVLWRNPPIRLRVVAAAADHVVPITSVSERGSGQLLGSYPERTKSPARLHFQS